MALLLSITPLKQRSYYERSTAILIVADHKVRSGRHSSPLAIACGSTFPTRQTRTSMDTTTDTVSGLTGDPDDNVLCRVAFADGSVHNFREQDLRSSIE